MPDCQQSLPPAASEFPVLARAGMTQEQVGAYAGASGDDNPIHTDPVFARNAGLDGCVVPGMLIAGQFEMALQEWSPAARLTGTAIRFVRALLVGHPFTMQGRVVEHRPEAADVIWRILVRDHASQIVCLCDARVVE